MARVVFIWFLLFLPVGILGCSAEVPPLGDAVKVLSVLKKEKISSVVEVFGYHFG